VKIVVVGAGLVGEEMVKCLGESEIFKGAELKILARSSRKQILAGETFEIKRAEPEEFKEADIAFFAGTEGEKGAIQQFAEEAIREYGVTVIDKGSDFRGDPLVPLVIPGVNSEDLDWHRGFIASPNCLTIQIVVAIYLIHQIATINKAVITSFQSVSGAGRKAKNQLMGEIEELVQPTGKFPGRVLPNRIALNVIPQIGEFHESGFTSEELKTEKESRKILHDPGIKITSTTVRVPVDVGHSATVYIETKEPLEPEETREILAEMPGIRVVDDPKNDMYPMPIDVKGKNEILVGRIRKAFPNENALWLWVVADNLRTGAALNATRIAEELVRRDLLRRIQELKPEEKWRKDKLRLQF